MVIANAFYIIYTIKYSFQDIGNQLILLSMMIKSSALLEAVNESSTETEKRIVEDIEPFKESHQNGEQNRAVFIPIEHNMANA